MKRTYRSKKEVGGGLDRRDVLLTVDEKQSVFDAFYIQNIKQTKRELSCMAHSGISSNKVRKKKYVKRIVKDTEPTLHEYISQVAYLTPDKSLRVNKVPDLFDQLLNSSPVSFTPQKPNKNSVLNTLHLKRENKIKARRKRLAIAKKYNFSSSDSSDSEKENTTDISNVTQEASDIKAHELLVEKIPKTSPKGIDESISNIVRNISLLAKHRKSNVGSSSMQNEFKNDQTTDNQYLQFVQSPILQKSPLCSTPFNDKIRSKSIYKFSPIPIGKFDESPKFLTIFEENKDNDSTKSYDNEDKSVILCKEKEFTASPIIPVKSFKLSKSKENVTSNSIPLIKDDSSVVNCEIELAKIDYCASEKTGDNIIQKDISLTNTEKSELSLVNSELSSCQITETEPFLGFQNTNSSLILTTSSVQPERIESIIKKSSLSAFEVESTLPEQPFLGFSNVNDNSHQKLNTSREYSTSSQNMTISSDDERESLYDTCDTEDNYSDTGTETENNLKFPIVHIERMRDSSFQRYLEKMHACKSTKSNDNSVEIIEDSETDSFTSVHDDEYVTESNEIISENVESDFEECLDSHYEPTDVTSYDTDSSEFTENNNATCVSFVTTRRRNDGTRNSTLQIFDSTFASPCNDFENTIINIKRDKSDLVNNSINTIYEVDDENVDKNKSNIKGGDKIDFAEELDVKRTSYVTTRKSSRVRESKSYEALDDSSVDLKCGIVLEPGKKWERSLSIYRRMTMTDNFESTFFNDEQLHGKGRKYRQSVICTMEMQDKNGSLHNESISSRRSTFVSKPSRSTIRIIKEPGNISSISLNATDFEDIKGFLGEDCDDTVIELSKLSIAESDHDITVIEQFHETPSRVTTPRDYVLRRCNQTEVLPFDECYPDTVLKNCHKIGEGVYGEVFLWRARDGHARVMKIVPIAGTVKVNGEPQKDFQEIISEIVIAMELSSLRAPISEIERHFDEGKEVEALDLHAVQNATDIFNEVLAVRCVYGNYPSRLLDLWELYDETKGSENDNPAILPTDQQYIVLELANAGQDLESYQFNNAEQAYALFYQLAFGLAVAEEAYEFEHRDLHWGNVLITPTEQKYCTFVLRGRAHRVARRGVAGAVIDYSLSRLRAGSARLYHDLATDDALFLAVGDYQFHVYRLMREKTGNDWQNFEPYTNLLWLHYILDKMITALRYKRTGTKIHKHYISKLKDLKNRILDYGSTVQFVLTDNEY